MFFWRKCWFYALPDSKVSVSVSHGSDGYLHAVKLSGDVQTPSTTLDSSTSASAWRQDNAVSGIRIVIYYNLHDTVAR